VVAAEPVHAVMPAMAAHAVHANHAAMPAVVTPQVMGPAHPVMPGGCLGRAATEAHDRHNRDQNAQ
jgi:hypothetical protein